MAQLGESSSMHTIQDEEERSFVGYINSTLKVCFFVCAIARSVHLFGLG